MGLALAAVAVGSFQGTCERLVGDRPAAVVALGTEDGRLRALVHPGLAGRPTPPGSVFKLVTATAALRVGAARPGETLTCRGWLRAPLAGGRAGVVRCWKPEGHGRLGLEGALAASCNLYFVQLGRKAGPEELREAAGACGLAGDVDARDARIAIGEGRGWLASPLQLAGLARALAGGSGVLLPGWRDHKPSPAFLPPEQLQRLRTGMQLAVATGSAKRATTSGLAVWGKTGTGTYRDGSNRTHGWFAGWARPKDGGPGLAVAVLVDDASGFAEAATLAGRVFAAWRDAGRP